MSLNQSQQKNDLKYILTSDVDLLTYPINLTANNSYQPISAENLLGFVSGEYQFDYIHNTMSYPVEPSQTYIFNYDSEVTIKLGSKKEEEFILTGNPSTAKKIFQNPKDDEETYTSTATYYSELKPKVT